MEIISERHATHKSIKTKGKSPKQGLTNAKDLPMEFPDGRESPYHRLD